MSGHTLAAAFAGTVAMTLGGCANLSDTMDDDGPTSVTFRCDDDRNFLALFSEDRRRAFVETGDETYELALVDRDGNELDYANRDDVRLTVDGNDGYLRIPDDDDFEDCRT
jgi:hypothetical protein